VRTLQEAKREVSTRFVGQSGIQGVGTRVSENAVYVYLARGVRLKPSVEKQIVEIAAPFAVVTEESGRAVLAGAQREEKLATAKTSARRGIFKSLAKRFNRSSPTS
jgi:hypothetical protein